MNNFWSIKDHYDNKIIDFTYWHNIDELQVQKGRFCVYVFANLLHQVRYVADDIDIIMVKKLFRENYSGIKIFKTLYTKNKEEADLLKYELISKYQLSL